MTAAGGTAGAEGTAANEPAEQSHGDAGASDIATLLDIPGLDDTAARLEPGTVALVGGGPGAWDLITVRGLLLLKQADVVVVDRLGPVTLVDGLGSDVDVIDVGKTPGRSSMSQEQINALLVEKARSGARVVRLKGGDPFVLGRGGEELLACRAADIDVQVVPGVTSSVAGPAAAGIPVTHRGSAVAVHVVNAHGDLGPADLAALRDPGTTAVLMMGVSWLPRLRAQALLSGIDPDLPMAVVQSATLPQQRSVHGTLDTIVERVEHAGITHPAVIIAGRTAQEGFLVPTDAEASVAGSGRQALPGDEIDAPGPDARGESSAPVLVACAHGTRLRAGRDSMRRLLMRLRERHPALPLREAYVDVQNPSVHDVVAALAEPAAAMRTRAEDQTDHDAGPQVIVVPMLLSTGYHVREDIHGCVRGRRAVAAEPLGPDPRLAQVMAERLAEAGLREDDAVVMAAAGTRSTAGQDMSRQMAEHLSTLLGRPVTTAFIAAAEPTPAQAVAAAREQLPAGGRVAVASYLLSPGRFQEMLTDCGADLIAEPMGVHDLLIDVAIDRYEAALGH